MNFAEQFRDIRAWQAALGLLPIPLREEDRDQRFALLNGPTGNFCLDYVGDTTRDTRARAAWSADVGHYVTLTDDRLLLTRWDRPSSEETYSVKSILEKLHEFHRYLEKEAPSRSKSVVAHSLHIFRKIRAMVADDMSGAKSLPIFLHLIASSAANVDRIEDEPLKWGLLPETIQLSKLIVSDASWSGLQRDLCGLGEFDVPRPEVALILRHAAGSVFEEAHRAATLPSTLWLPGFERPIDLRQRNNEDVGGVFFTPAALARTLSEEAILSLDHDQRTAITIFDPACGSGELLRETLRLIRLRGFKGRVKLLGWDISPIAVQMAHFILNWEQRSWTMFPVDIVIETHDSLAEAWPTEVDLVIMNPPFLAWTKMSPRQKEQVTSILGELHVNRPNLAMLFSARAITSLRDGGVLASIVPNSFLEASSSKPLRKKLADISKIELIARLGSQNIFSDALVDAGFYIAKKGDDSPDGTTVLWSNTAQSAFSHALRGLRRSHRIDNQRRAVGVTSESDFSIYQRDDIARSGNPWIAREFKAWQFYSRLSDSKKTIAAKKLVEINQGVRMGDDVFIVPKAYVEDLSVGERAYFRPAVMNPSISNGKLIDHQYIFYPNSLGLETIEDEQSLRRLVPRFSEEVLFPNQGRLQARKSLHDKRRWWGLSEPRRWLESKNPRIASKYFGKERPFAFDRTGEFVIVVGHSWSLRSDAPRNDETSAEEVYLALTAFLNSSMFIALANYTSVQVAGGQMDLSNRYVESVPLPNPAKLSLALIRRLASIGEHITSSEPVDWNMVDEGVASTFFKL